MDLVRLWRLMTNDVTSLRVALGLGVMIVVDIILYSICGLYHINSKNRFYFSLKNYDTGYFLF